jgi:hypothetical protein
VKRYGNFPETWVREWLNVAKENASILSRGIDQLAFQDERCALPQVFHIEGFLIAVELRQEIGRVVVEVCTRNSTFIGRTFTIILVGGTGEEERVEVTLDRLKGPECYGSAVADGSGSDVVDKLGPIIVPIMLHSE